MNWKSVLLVASTLSCAQSSYALPCRDQPCEARMSECAAVCSREARMFCRAALEPECEAKCRFDTDTMIHCRSVSGTCDQSDACRIR